MICATRGARVMSWGSDDRQRVSYSARCPNLSRASPSPPSTQRYQIRPAVTRQLTSRLMTASPYSAPIQARLSTYTVHKVDARWGGAE
jgi:hypothetical protein